LTSSPKWGTSEGVVAKISSPKIGVDITEVAPKSTPVSITAPAPSELTTPALSFFSFFFVDQMLEIL
jgi:hypothetical protein